MRKNKLKLGLGFLTVLATPIAVNAVASSDVQAAQGWVKSGNTWYFYNQTGALVRNAWAGNYWLGADGRMATNTWVDNGRYYVGTDGAWVKNAQKQAITKQGWVQSGNTWYYYNNGSLVVNKWIGNYWLGADGKMATNSWVDNSRYYVGANGAWIKDAKHPEEKKQGWVKEGTTWYYYNTDGTLARNKWVGNYWLGADGKMVTSAWVDNGRYYVDTNGAWVKDAKRPEEKKQGWVKEANTWYYYNTDGTLARNKWAGNYWLGADGRMVTNGWVDNNRYYVGANGTWVPNPTNNTNLNRVLDIARSYLGVETGSKEHKKIVDAYNSVNPKPAGYTAKYDDDWCDIFVTTVFQQAGLSHLIGRECGVQRHIGIMEKKGIWKGKSLPQQGDIVTFDWDGGGWADHIGIVESASNGVITTIEGNSSLSAGSTEKTRVNRKTYNWDSKYIKGYVRPAY